MSALNDKPNLQEKSSLDDLFGAARGSANYLEGESARQSILNDVMDRATQPIMPVRRAVRRYSTPFKIGAVIMTSLTLGAISIIALGIFSPAPKQRLLREPTQAIIQSATKPPVNAFTPQSVATIFTARWGSRVHAPLAARKSDTAWLAPLRMEAIKPILITHDQAAQLGILCENNGNIVYRDFGPHGQLLLTQTYHLNGREDVSTNGSDSSQVASPARVRMITTVTGEKRFFQFEENQFPLGHTLTQFGLDSTLDDSVQTAINIHGSEDSAKNTDAGMSKSLEMSNEDSAFAKQFAKTMGMDPTKTKHINISINLQSVNDSVAMKKLLASLGLQPDEINHISEMLAANHDSSYVATKIVPMILQKLSTMMNQKSPQEMMELAKSAMTEIAEHQPDVNTLIPVLVENQGSIGEQNALVFWFEPSTELQTVLGDQYGTHFSAVEQVAPKGALHGLLINPNPATGSATLHYTLDDSRSVRASVYDITGNKILDAATISDHPAGDGELKLDLSTLPAGVYVVALTTDKFELITQRIVVEK